MIALSSETMIGKGLHRECFIHPDDDNKCIKVVVNGNQQETDREQSYLQSLLIWGQELFLISFVIITVTYQIH
jgi:hypothetical protein